MGLFEYLKTWLIVKWAVKEQIPQIIQDTCTKFNLSKIVAKNETSHDFYNTLYFNTDLECIFSYTTAIIFCLFRIMNM